MLCYILHRRFISYIVQLYIKTDCFEILTFTPSKYTGIEYPRCECTSLFFSPLFFYERGNVNFFPAFFPLFFPGVRIILAL